MYSEEIPDREPIVSEEDRRLYPWLRLRVPGEHRNRVIVSDEGEWEAALPEFVNEIGHFNVIGFDLEGVSLVNYRKEMDRGRREMVELAEVVHDNLEAERPALLQMATLGGFVLILQLAYFKEIPRSLKKILDSEEIIKVGVSIEGDAYWFLDRWGARVKGWIDLRHICKDAEMQVPWELELKGRMGLKHLGMIFFGESRIGIEQMKLLSYSNWAKLDLSEKQLYYATFDAQIAVDICGVVAQKLIPTLEVFWDGKEVLKGRRKLQSVLRPHLHRGFSRSEAPLQAFKMDDLVSPNMEEDEKAANLREYILTVCEPLTDQAGQTEVCGMEPSIRFLLRKDLGRLPALVRSAAKCLTESRQCNGMTPTEDGFAGSIMGKLRADRRGLLPEVSQGRYPPMQWVHVPKLCDKRGYDILEEGGEMLRLKDALHPGKMNLVWDLELGTTVKYRRVLDGALASETSGKETKKDLPRDNQIVSVTLPRKTEQKEKLMQVVDWLSDEVSPAEDIPEEGKDGMLGDDLACWMSANGIASEEDTGTEWTEVCVSVCPCWGCGNAVISDLCWEPVVPLSYVQLYVSFPRCICNWARLCRKCCRVWRLTQYQTMLELAAALHASIDTPKYFTTQKTVAAREAATKLVQVEKAKETRWLSPEQREERAGLFRILKEYTGENFIDLNKVLNTIEAEWYTPNWQNGWHESKIVWDSAMTLESLESCFRQRLISMCSKGPVLYLPDYFANTHPCLIGIQQTLPKMMTEAELSEVAKKSHFFCDLDEAIHGDQESSVQPAVAGIRNFSADYSGPNGQLQSPAVATSRLFNRTDPVGPTTNFLHPPPATRHINWNLLPEIQRKTEISSFSEKSRVLESQCSMTKNPVGVTFFLSDESAEESDRIRNGVSAENSLNGSRFSGQPIADCVPLTVHGIPAPSSVPSWWSTLFPQQTPISAQTSVLRPISQYHIPPTSQGKTSWTQSPLFLHHPQNGVEQQQQGVAVSHHSSLNQLVPQLHPVDMVNNRIEGNPSFLQGGAMRSQRNRKPLYELGIKTPSENRMTLTESAKTPIPTEIEKYSEPEVKKEEGQSEEMSGSSGVSGSSYGIPQYRYLSRCGRRNFVPFTPPRMQRFKDTQEGPSLERRPPFTSGSFAGQSGFRGRGRGFNTGRSTREFSRSKDLV